MSLQRPQPDEYADFYAGYIAHVPEGRGTFVRQTVEENLRLGAISRKDRNNLGPDFDRVYGYFPRRSAGH